MSAAVHSARMPRRTPRPQTGRTLGLTADSARSGGAGPPGGGKTTLARLLSSATGAHFSTLSAVMAGVADGRRLIAEAKERSEANGPQTVLFIDEIHRFNKAQQDALLPHVEEGTVTFIGATTENPYFSVVSPLLSRSRGFRLEAPTTDPGGGSGGAGRWRTGSVAWAGG